MGACPILKELRMAVYLSAKKRLKHSIPNFEIHSVLLFAALAMGAATAAQAQTSAASPTNPNRPRLQMASSDTIPPNKATSKDLEAAFKRADTDRDGKLNRQEIEHFPALAHRFEQIDTDHDSVISRDEFNQAAGF
jgi:hypothetical protein